MAQCDIDGCTNIAVMYDAQTTKHLCPMHAWLRREGGAGFFLGEIDYLSGGTDAQLATGTNEYFPVVGLAGPIGTILDRDILVDAKMKLSHLRVKLAVAPGAGKNRKIDIYKNGSATALTVTIANTDTTGEDITHTVDVVAGDSLCAKSTPTGTPAASRIMVSLRGIR